MAFTETHRVRKVGKASKIPSSFSLASSLPALIGIIIYAALGLASDAAVRAVESRVLSYRRTLGS